ncbi:hypothetical protein HA402_008666 [Bradysia odoriphaga]|nr:hypothetical protein HA402_008666 [Bradysia odoriphaga]
MWWMYLNILDLIPHHNNQLWSYDRNGFNGLINTLFWCCSVTFVIFYFFSKFLERFLRSQKVSVYKCTPTIRFIWNGGFYITCTTFLHFYHKYFIAPRILKETNSFFPKYRHALFLPTDHCTVFNSISIILATFYITAALFDVRERDFTEAASKCLFACVIMSLDHYGYENFSIILNTLFGLFNMFADCLTTASLYTKEQNKAFNRLFLFFRLITWSYLFLNVLPFKYLIPTLYAKKFKLWLNVFLWCWYGFSIWNSPILRYLNHQIYHFNSNDCIGNSSISRCILLKDSPEIRHQRILQRAVRDVRAANERNDFGGRNTENSSATAFQTIKCMMTLKRKLRRIRENKEIERLAKCT